jgi:tetrahydromethanopterin S-methyltransferase subunit G
METEPLDLEHAVQRLSPKVFGWVVGILFGLSLFLATAILVLKGGVLVGLHLSQLAYFFPGYRVTGFGSLIGLFYGFAFGFVCGALFAVIYNKLASA